MAKTSLTLFAVAVLLAAAPSAEAQSNPTGSWPSSEAINTGSGCALGGSASDGTHLYLVGGQYPYWTSFRRHDPVTNTWEDLGSLPEENAYCQAAHAGNHIYILGNGFYGNGNIYRYDIAGRSWEWMGTLDNNRYAVGAATYEDKIYIAGGWDIDNNTYSAALEVFDPSDRSLTTLSNMPTGLLLPLAAAVPEVGKIYFAGGRGTSGVSAACLEYDPSTDSWATRASISNGNITLPRDYPGGFALNGRLYVVGGSLNSAPTNTTLEYNPPTNSWAQRANLNYVRYGHASAVIGGFGYVYGGQTFGNDYRREKFVAPEFGLAPNLPVAAIQVGVDPEASQQGGWTNNQMVFQAVVTDPNAGQQVRLEAQVRPSGSTTWGAVLTSGNGAQGIRSITYSIPTTGSYDWRWRVADVINNYAPTVNGVPSWVEAFGNAVSPDFNSDQIVPVAPLALSPDDTDLHVPDPQVGTVTLNWLESTDNGPVESISYEIQVARDGGFHDIEAQLVSSAGNDSLDVPLSVSSSPKFWRLRARDVGGNFSPWSNIMRFRVTFNDGVDHAGGDGDKNCGFAAGAGSLGSLTAAFFGLALLAFAGKARRR